MTERLVTMLSAETIAARVRELGARDHPRLRRDCPLVLVCVLKGSFVFAADLARAIDSPAARRLPRRPLLRRGDRVERRRPDHAGPLAPHRARGRAPRRGHRRHRAHDRPLDGSLPHAPARASVKVCALLHKPARARVAVKIDYLGFTIEDKLRRRLRARLRGEVPEPAVHRRRGANLSRSREAPRVPREGDARRDDRPVRLVRARARVPATWSAGTKRCRRSRRCARSIPTTWRRT